MIHCCDKHAHAFGRITRVELATTWWQVLTSTCRTGADRKWTICCWLTLLLGEESTVWRQRVYCCVKHWAEVRQAERYAWHLSSKLHFMQQSDGGGELSAALCACAGAGAPWTGYPFALA